MTGPARIAAVDTATSDMLPVWARLLLINNLLVARHLAEIARAHEIEVPNTWQITLGVVRMWHRIVFRFNTIGTSTEQPVRDTLRAKILHWRPARFLPLLVGRAIAPWDLTGLLSSRERMIRHLIGAHHDGDQFVYDLQILSAQPGALEELQQRAAAVVNGTNASAEWLRDLCVHVGYHEALLARVNQAIGGDFAVARGCEDDPDITFFAWLRWCRKQPATPAQTQLAIAAGRFTYADGVRIPTVKLPDIVR